jgi:beta-lactam-binding protein with PASTA domain
MRFFYFFGRKKFYLQIPIVFVAVVALIIGVLYSLNIYTFHGEALNLPSYYGLTMDEIEQQTNENNFHYILTDSIYDTSQIPGTVILQNPLPNSKVKRNRKVYLTIIAKSPEQIRMPNLVDLSKRQALVTLKAKGLKVNTLHYIPDFAKHAVLAQLYQGDTIAPDSLIQKGSKIDLILGNGYNPQRFRVPFLIGKTQSEAHQIIHGSSLNIGEQSYVDENKYGGIYRVYTQFPEFDSDSLLSYGDFVNLEYRSDFAFNFEEYIEELFPDTLALDSIIMSKDSILLEINIDSLFIEQ